MIKAKSDKALIFGLSDFNIEKLKLGQPIMFNLKDMGLEDKTVIILYGKTERDIFKELKEAGLIDPTMTDIHDSTDSSKN